MSKPSYKQFCPVAMAAELLCTRWTLILIRECIAGSVRFNDLRRGVPRMSPTLLSQRLKELEQAGVIERRCAAGGTFEYHLTPAGRELGVVVGALGAWGHKWMTTAASLANLDVGLLMWDMRRNLEATPLPDRRTVIAFHYSELPSSRSHWWLVVEPQGEVDLCSRDPGFDVDLHFTTDLLTMTAIWMGYTSVEQQAARISLSGSRAIINSVHSWLGLSPFAGGMRKQAQNEKSPALMGGLSEIN